MNPKGGTMNAFKYDLNSIVQILVSGENGTVIGRTKYINSNPQYRIRYKCADGRAMEAWWEEDAIGLA